MLVPWLLASLVLVCAAEPGSSLRGAVEALQRRQRGHARSPVLPMPDYDALYEFIPPGYPESEYPVDIEDIEEEPNPKYIVKFLEQNERPPVDYEYKIVKKKSSRFESPPRKESSFRERSHHSDNDRLRELFSDSNEKDKNEALHDRAENDAEYALLLSQLWAKYKNNKAHGNIESAPPGVVKLYKEKIVKKRYPDNWGPIAFKRKRSSDSDIERPVIPDYEPDRRQTPATSDPNYNAYDVSDDDKNDDWRDEYAIAFQPLDDTLSDTADEDQYSYESVQKRFPVTKRSSGPYYNIQKKRFVQSQNKHNKAKTFRSSAGTDPKIIKDLSKIFGEMEMKYPVKRNVNKEETFEPKPPQLIMMTHNNTHKLNATKEEDNDDSHEQHGHSLHHPGMSGKESEHGHEHNHEHEIHSHHNHDKPVKIQKKSIDWSDYFGIDKRSKKFIHDVNENRLKQQYLDTFNKEVVYPLNSFRRHTTVKRNYVEPTPREESVTQSDDKRSSAEDDTNAKIENLDKNLRNVEDLIVDEALHYSDSEDELDSKEEQEMKEKMLQKLATAYSLEKMRKALKEFKQSLQTQRTETSQTSLAHSEISKTKRVAVKKEKVDIRDNEIPALDKLQDKDDDFEAEEGAGHYLNGKIDRQLSEGYMEGSGKHRTPMVSTVGAAGACPVLAKIIQRCHGVDMLAGDRGQLFLPLCSLHQICYLCGEAPPTTCDLVFLSEADTTCDGDMGCQRSARSALMALRELHGNLTDEMDGECEASPCLPATLKLNINWHRALQR